MSMTATPTELFTIAMREAKWLRDNPRFEERPASMPEFLGPSYLNIEKHVRPAVREVLIDLFGEETNPHRIARYERGIYTGAIGIGKTTVASIVLPYMAHWVLCLKDPQGFFDLMPGSRIAFMQMSTSGPQAKEVVFGDIKARIENSPWFTAKYPYDKTFKNQIRFSKEIWILPGDSAETTFEGYNILGGILDEIDSHKVTKVKDYAEQGYTTIHGRITSRFQDRGFILLVGQMKKATGFAAKMYRDMKTDKQAYVCRMKIWESLGWGKFLNPDGTHNSFWYDISRYAETTEAYAEMMGYPETIIEVPMVYRRDFMNSPMKALRDLCGLPPAVSAPFIHNIDKVDEARQRWKMRYGLEEGPVDAKGNFADWFVSPNGLKRVLHVDVAYSGDGDALGMAMGHVAEMVEIEGERKPIIVIDFALRLKAPPGRELFLPDVRKIIYNLRDERRFRIVKVTTDGFESTEMRQQLQRKRFFTDKISVDRDMLPYQDCYDTLMDGRLMIPPYLTYANVNDTDMVDIVRKEASELSEVGNKIDHPPDGSKDVMDAIAAVIHELSGSRMYKTASVAMDQDTGLGAEPTSRVSSSPAWFQHPAVDTNFKGSAPVPNLFGDPVPFAPPRR